MTELERLERKLSKLYKDAERELKAKWMDYLHGWDEPDGDKLIHHLGMYERKEKEEQALIEGTYTQEDFDAWWLAQEGRGSHWADMRDQMAQRATETNQIASGYINGTLPKVYTKSSNAVASLAQESAMDQGITGIRFDLVDEATIRHLVEDRQDHTSFKVTRINPKRDYEWNREKIHNALTQGILQGESMDKIADRFLAVMGQNRASAIRNARTSVTSAMNAGRQDRMDDLAKQGCISMKYWKDVHDSVPPERAWHWEASETYDKDHPIPYDEPFYVKGEALMFPCDPSGSPENVYNCRCTTGVSKKFTFRSVLSDEMRKKANIRIVE